MTTMERPQSANLREYCGWTGNTEDDIVEQARLYILTDCNGSFEKFAMWGLVRPLAQV